MKVTGTPTAVRVVEKICGHRLGELVFVVGTGCCESTAPFLYEDFWLGPDQEIVGTVASVPVYAPAHLRALYPADAGMTVDVEEGVAESFSLETEFGYRFLFRETPLSSPESFSGNNDRNLGSSVG